MEQLRELRCNTRLRDKGSKASSIDEGINIEAGNTGFFIRSHLDFDVARVASSIDPIDFLSVEGDADGSPGFTR